MPPKTAQNRRSWWIATIAAGPGWVFFGAAKQIIGAFLAVYILDAVGALAAVEPKYGLVMGLVTYVQGAYRLSIELAQGYAENPAAFSSAYAAGLREVVDPRRLPALGELVEMRFFEGAEDYDVNDNRDFDFGLSVYLDGVAAQIERFTR
jgi:hypothetical protein